MRRLNRTYQRSKSNHLLYLLLFVVGLFFLMYWGWVPLSLTFAVALPHAAVCRAATYCSANILKSYRRLCVPPQKQISQVHIMEEINREPGCSANEDIGNSQVAICR